MKENQSKNSGRNQKAGTKAECMGENPAYWPVSPSMLSYLSYKAHVHLPRDGTTHRRLDLPISVSNKRNVSEP